MGIKISRVRGARGDEKLHLGEIGRVLFRDKLSYIATRECLFLGKRWNESRTSEIFLGRGGFFSVCDFYGYTRNKFTRVVFLFTVHRRKAIEKKSIEKKILNRPPVTGKKSNPPCIRRDKFVLRAATVHSQTITRIVIPFRFVPCRKGRCFSSISDR